MCESYLYGSLEYIKFEALTHAWCLKHKEPYKTWIYTARSTGCESCHNEWLKLINP